ncbi:MAG: Maf family protein [Acidimicrobiales bacterium]
MADSPTGVDQDPQVTLASASPRRRVLLAMVGVPVAVVPAEVDERGISNGLEPLEAVLATARAKANAVASSTRPVLAADTIVCLGEEILGKPDDDDHARTMLEAQSGNVVQVITAVAILLPDGSAEDRIAVSTLRIDSLDDRAIDEYLATGEADDKAGALAFQGSARAFTELLDGSKSNVVGLPLAETIELLTWAGIPVDASAVEEP